MSQCHTDQPLERKNVLESQPQGAAWWFSAAQRGGSERMQRHTYGCVHAPTTSGSVPEVVGRLQIPHSQVKSIILPATDTLCPSENALFALCLLAVVLSPSSAIPVPDPFSLQCIGFRKFEPQRFLEPSQAPCGIACPVAALRFNDVIILQTDRCCKPSERG